MRPLPALFVALLLILGAVAPAVGAAGSAAQSADAAPLLVSIDNTTNQLAIPGTEVTAMEHNQTGIDVGTAVAADSRQLRTEHATLTFEHRYQALNSTTDRRQAVRNRLDELSSRQQTLAREQSRATQAYASGRITATEFVRTRATTDAEARQLETAVKRVRRTIRNDPDLSLTSGTEIRSGNLVGELKILQGAVSQYSLQTFVGSRSGTVYVEASPTGYSVSTIANGEYVRETHLATERDPNATDQFVESDQSTVIAAAARASELYPWLYEQQGPSVNGFGTSGIYEFAADHSNGRIVTYIDGGTTNTFHESQYRRLSAVTATDAQTGSNGAVTVRVRRAYETGPLLVSVTDSATGTPVDARISIDGRPVGSTGADGSLWTVEPRGSYDVNATIAGNDSVTVSVSGR